MIYFPFARIARERLVFQSKLAGLLFAENNIRSSSAFSRSVRPG